MKAPDVHSRMTNGKVVKHKGGGVVLQFKGGSLGIVLPPNVTVTEIVPASPSALKVGKGVFALGSKAKDGSWDVNRVMLMPSPPK